MRRASKDALSLAGAALALTLCSSSREVLAAPAAPSVAPAGASGASAPAPVDAAKALEQALVHAPKGPDALVSLALTDAEATELLKVMSEMTGRRFVLAAPKAKAFKATIVAPQKITVREAYQAFLAILQANGLTVLPGGDFWKVVETQDVARQATPVTKPGEAPTGDERYVTHIHRLAHVSAEEVATTVLAKLQTRDASVVPYAPGNLLILTETGENIRRMTRILDALDVASAGDKVFLQPLHYVAASDLAKRVEEILSLDAKAKGAQGIGAGDAHITKIVAVDRPNALAIVAAETAYRRILDLVDQLDVPQSSEGEIHVVALQHADAKKIVGPLLEAVGGGAAAPPAKGAGGAQASVLDGPVKISAEESTNSILVTATPRDFLAVRRVIAALDQKRRQVYIEAVVMDLSMEHAGTLGVSLHGGAPAGDALAYGGLNVAQSASAPASLVTGSDPSLQALALGVRGPTLTGIPGISIPSFGALITAAVTDKRADILSTPNILASDNTPAEIHVQTHTALQQNVPAFPSLAALGGSNASNPLAGLAGLAALGSGATGGGASAFGNIGPKIKVTPHINESDEVRLDVEETISDLLDEKPQGTTGSIAYMERGATTTLTVKDQETVVIGGLVRSKHARTETKIPLLGDIPLIGALFRSSADKVEKANLVLVLTPYIIRDQSDLRRIFERKMQERQEFLDHHMVFGDEEHDVPRNFTHAGGLLRAVRRASLEIEERRKLEEPATPIEAKGHAPVRPIELPAGAPPVKVAPDAPAPSPVPVRGVARIEG